MKSRSAALVLVLVLQACATPASLPPSDRVAASATTPAGSASVTPPSASASAASTPVSPPASPGGPIPLPYGCTEANPCRLAAGTYVLAGQFAFMVGLTLSVPVPWTSGEQDLGEFSVAPGGTSGGLLFWKDLTPVGHDGTPLRNVDRTAAGLVEWLRHNPDFVTSEPQSATIGKDIRAITLLVGVSKSAKNADPDCPVAACVALFTDTEHWPQAYALGRQNRPLYFRLYLADIVTGSEAHTLVVGLDAGDAAGLGVLETLAKPILDSVSLPPGTVPAAGATPAP